MARVARKVHDKALLQLIGRYLRAGVMVDGQLQATTEGTPQGGPASPLLANILLDDLDKELEQRGLPFVRYADDFVIFTKSQRSAQRVFDSVHRYLTRKLHLVVNLEKSRIVPTEELEYLGSASWVHERRSTCRKSPSNDSSIASARLLGVAEVSRWSIGCENSHVTCVVGWATLHLPRN